MKAILLYFLLISTAWAQNCSVYLDRPEYAETQFFDLNIEDEYVLSKKTEPMDSKILTTVKKIVPKLNFGEKKINQAIVRHFNRHTILNAFLVKNLANQTRKVYLVKYNLDNTHYYSFLLYFGCVNG